jgi:HEAT repeat protein
VAALVLLAVLLAVALGVIAGLRGRHHEEAKADAPAPPIEVVVPDPVPAPAGPVFPELPPDRPNPTAAELDALIEVVRAGRPGDRVTAVHRIARLAPVARRAIPTLLAALENADPELDAALTATLDRIGAPPREYVPLMVRALESKSDGARGYAVHAFATRVAVPEEAIRPLVALLGDPHAVVRTRAAAALERAGEKARPLALGPLVALTGDLDPGARKAAADALRALGKPEGDDRAVLQKLLADKSPRVRVAALGLVGPLVTTGDQAAAVYAPLLADDTPDVRLAALRGLVAIPDSLPKAAAKVTPLLTDSDRGVRAAAIDAAGRIPMTPGVADAVAAAYRTETDAELRTSLALAFVAVAEPKPSDLPVLRAILADGTPKVRRAAADKVALLGSDAAPAVNDLITLATDPSAEVRAAALRALAAAGPAAKPAFDLAAASFKDNGAPAEVRLAAVDVLAACGPDGLKELKEATSRHPPDPIKAHMCEVFAAAGKDARDTYPWMLDTAEAVAACRPAVGDALVKGATDEVVMNLTLRTDVFRPWKPVVGEIPYPVGYRKWALETLGKIDLAKVASPDTRSKLETRMKHLADGADPEIVRLATAVLKKLGS